MAKKIKDKKLENVNGGVEENPSSHIFIDDDHEGISVGHGQMIHAPTFGDKNNSGA